MFQRQWILLLIAFGLTMSKLEGSEPKPSPPSVPANLAQAKLDAARRNFEAYWDDKAWRDVEIPYRWSRRWLMAECEVSDKWEDRVAAFGRHLDRMKELEQITRKGFEDRFISEVQVKARNISSQRPLNG